MTTPRAFLFVERNPGVPARLTKNPRPENEGWKTDSLRLMGGAPLERFESPPEPVEMVDCYGARFGQHG